MIMGRFPVCPTSLITFLTPGLLWTKLVYVLDNKVYKVVPLNLSSIKFHFHVLIL